MEEHGNNKIKSCYILAKSGLDAPDRVRIEELYFGAKYLENHLVVHLSVAKDEDGEDNQRSDEAHSDEKEDQDRPGDWVFGLLLLFQRFLSPV